MVGIMVCVFVLEKHRMHVRDLQDAAVGTGVMGVIGNKGGAAVRFGLYDSTLYVYNDLSITACL
jgi:phosphatidylinositol-bisphosphatase